MEAGRKKLPTALKKLKGTYRPDREIENEMMPTKLDFAPSPPAFLDAREAMEFESVCSELAELNMLHRTDLSLIAAYCVEITGYIRTSELIKIEGTIINGKNKLGESYAIQNPLMAVKNSYFNNAKAMATQFGLTPSARTKIAAPPPDGEGSFDEMLNLDDDE